MTFTSTIMHSCSVCVLLCAYLTIPATSANSEVYSRVLKQINDSSAVLELCKTSNVSGCSVCHYKQIASDLAPFSEGITKQDLNRAAKFGVRYQIIEGRLFRDKECMFPFRCSGIEHFLLKEASKLPDLEMVVNVRDYPQSPRRLGKLPIFSFSKVPKDYYDILYPAWTFWEGGPAISIYPRGIGRWDIRRESLLTESDRVPWNDKENKGFFRGSRTSAERDPLVRFSRVQPDLIDAMYTKNQAWRSEKDTLGASPASEVSFEEHCKFKYLFNFRGVAASFRFKHLFLCNSLVFHVGPTNGSEDWIEFFYPMLKPWQHYLPVSVKELDRVEFLLNFVKEYPDVARKIANNGFKAVKDHLRMKDIHCYWRKLLKRYANLLKFDIVRDPNLNEITVKRAHHEL